MVKKSHLKILLKIFNFSKLNLISIVKDNFLKNALIFINSVKYFNNKL